MIVPRLQVLTEKKLIGQHMSMSLADNKTQQLWQQFMPRRGEINHRVSSDLLSLQVYAPTQDMRDFHLHSVFDKWAAVEVSQVDPIPEGMEHFLLPGGLYAVFDYKGSSGDPSIFQYIYGTWLPDSAYVLDHRPQFEVLGEKYRNNDPESEEEIWIPIRTT